MIWPHVPILQLNVTLQLQVTELQSALRLLPPDQRPVNIKGMRKAELISSLCEKLLLV